MTEGNGAILLLMEGSGKKYGSEIRDLEDREMKGVAVAEKWSGREKGGQADSLRVINESGSWSPVGSI